MLSAFEIRLTTYDEATINNSIQLSQEGEVNSGGYIPRREVSRYICCGLILLLVENFCKPAHFFLTSLFFSNHEYNFEPAYFCKPAHFF